MQRNGDWAVDFVLTSRGTARVVSEAQYVAESSLPRERAVMEYEYLRTHRDYSGMVFEP